jgi:hypothetical protein
MTAVVALLCLLVGSAVIMASGSAAELPPQSCDVLIAGGSTAALSTALTAAVAGGPGLSVCLTEPTDELGGQLAFNPAIDYGSAPKKPSVEWGSLTKAVTSHPSACRVSSSCFRPRRLGEWVAQRLVALPNLHVMLRTTVRGAVRDPSSGRVQGLELVSRTFKGEPAHEWESLLSEVLPDWYSEADSALFTKHPMTVNASVVVEASELGDVLYTARLPHTQGAELPTEASLEGADDGLTQSACFTFFMQLLAAAPSQPDPAPAGAAGPLPFWQTLCCCSGGAAIPGTQNCSWSGIWSFRQTTKGAGGPSGIKGVNVGDVSMQNWGHGNDMAAASLFIPDRAAQATVQAGRWAGGANLTAIAMMEARAFGWFHAFKAGNASNSVEPGPPRDRLVLNRNYSGTTSGLSKFPYVRETRRAVGLGGFRLLSTMMMKGHPVRFNDTVGVGGYNFDVKPGAGYGAANGGPRRLPSYMWNTSTNTGLAGHAAPFQFPFRALTVQGAPNVLACGKTLAMSFAANTAAREHLDEWSSGVGAGAAAAMMVARGWTTVEMLSNVAVLQARLRSPDIAQPLEWGSPDTPTASPSPGSYVCRAARCFEVSGKGAYSNSSCLENCAGLHSNEWLLLTAHWHIGAGKRNATARFDTVLKKSEKPGDTLPPSERRVVQKGTVLGFAQPLLSADESYWLAKVLKN